ncbi:MAG: hypothetical protein J5659_03790 [Clostridia bacterium]|nr:hypothetical protein [Clostridia bacterium]
MKRLVSVIAVIAIVFALCFSVSASEPTSSFVHEETANGTVTAQLSREMYSAVRVITANSLGLEKSLTGLSDLCCDEDGLTYLLCSDRSIIVVLNKDYTLNKTFSVVDEGGNAVYFEGAQGIYVDQGKLYICDTRQARILVCDLDGKLLETLNKPESSLIPEEFYYQPCKITKNNRGYTYILSLGCYYGALAYSPEGEFLGFYGANTVKASALDTISYLWDRLTQTDAKKSLTVKKLPYSFVDLCLDSKGYMITCTGSVDDDTNGTGQLRKLSPGGDDILYKTSFDGSSVSASSYNFVEEKIIKRFGVNKPQNVIAVDVDEDGFIYALDSRHALIYVYDDECNMICGFGGGEDYLQRLGGFDSVTSLKVNGTDVLVTDYDNFALTVFERTDYGNLITKAQSLYLKGEYDEAAPLWEQVLALNSNSQLAYRGLAMASINNKEYTKALKYAKAGLDYSVYDMAWKVVRNKYISDNFVWLFGLIVLVVGGLIVLSVYAKRKGFVLLKSEKVKIALSTPVHPFNAFDDIRYKNKGSILVACVIVFLYYLGKVFEATGSGFLFTRSDPTTYNTVYTIIGTIGLVVLWSVCNWLICSLFSGKGKLSDVFIVTAYSLIPLTVYTYVRVILSHVLSISGLSIMDGIYTVVLLFTFFILSIAIMTAHEYDFFKFLSTSIVTVLFMILVVFVIFLVGVLLQQVGEFILSLLQEIFYR